MGGGQQPDDEQPVRLLSRTPAPRSVVECGSYSNPNNGCTDEREDAIAAYTDALAWYLTGDARYAQKSIQIMDAWSATITAHTGSNAPLQTGWAASVWPGRPRSSSTRTPAGPTPTASPPCCATSTCRWCATDRTATATGSCP
ncbi:alginate lyase family protein [Micromonospora sp. M12]